MPVPSFMTLMASSINTLGRFLWYLTVRFGYGSLVWAMDFNTKKESLLTASFLSGACLPMVTFWQHGIQGC